MPISLITGFFYNFFDFRQLPLRCFFAYYLLKVHLQFYLYHSWKKNSQNSRNKGFSFYFWLISVPLTNGSGRPKKRSGTLLESNFSCFFQDWGLRRHRRFMIRWTSMNCSNFIIATTSLLLPSLPPLAKYMPIKARHCGWLPVRSKSALLCLRELYSLMEKNCSHNPLIMRYYLWIAFFIS